MVVHDPAAVSWCVGILEALRAKPLVAMVDGFTLTQGPVAHPTVEFTRARPNVVPFLLAVCARHDKHDKRA